MPLSDEERQLLFKVEEALPKKIPPIPAQGPLTLRAICLQAVVQDLPRLAEKETTNFCEVLPQVLWKEILLSYTKSCRTFDGLLKVAPLFVHKNTFDDQMMGPLGKHERYKLRTFYQKLASTSSLVGMKVSRTRMLHQDFYQGRKAVMSILTSTLLNLENFGTLVKLEIYHYNSKDQDLAVISKNLKQLQYLYLILHSKVTCRKGLSKLAALPSLQRFPFNSANGTNFRMKSRVNYCLVLMPYLKEIGNSAFIFGNHNLSNFQGPVELGLENVTLNSDQVIPTNVSLPNVINLGFYANDAGYICKFSELPLFDKVKAISFTSYKSCDILTVLGVYGRQLESLKIYKSQQTSAFNFKQILLLCPSLRSLHLEGCVLQDSLDTSEIKGNLCLIKDIQLNHIGSSCLIPQGFLQALFMAPAIQKISIQGARFENQELEMFILGLAEKKLNGSKLLSLGLHVTECNGKALVCKLISQVLSSCPNLLELQIYYQGYRSATTFGHLFGNLNELFYMYQIKCAFKANYSPNV